MSFAQTLKSNTVKAIKDENIVFDEKIDLSDTDSDLLKIKESCHQAAENGKWEYSEVFDKKEFGYLAHLCAKLKEELCDIMVILDKGNKKITLSWYLSNEV